eukprot:1160979-Pelagomonas_calceolata.AAC.5
MNRLHSCLNIQRWPCFTALTFGPAPLQMYFGQPCLFVPISTRHTFTPSPLRPCNRSSVCVQVWDSGDVRCLVRPSATCHEDRSLTSSQNEGQ